MCVNALHFRDRPRTTGGGGGYKIGGGGKVKFYNYKQPWGGDFLGSFNMGHLSLSHTEVFFMLTNY